MDKRVPELHLKKYSNNKVHTYFICYVFMTVFTSSLKAVHNNIKNINTVLTETQYKRQISKTDFKRK